jgi:hypothetical protein
MSEGDKESSRADEGLSSDTRGSETVWASADPVSGGDGYVSGVVGRGVGG